MIKIKKSRLIAILAVTVIASLVLGALALVGYNHANNKIMVNADEYSEMKESTERYAKLKQIQDEMSANSIYDADEEVQMDGIYKGFVDSFGDEYASYMNKEEAKEWENYVNNSFSGIGLAFTSADKAGEYEVTGVYKDSPASAVGFKEGDILLAADGKRYSNSDDFARAIRGKEGTTVKLTYRRGKKENTVEVTRASVEQDTVASMVLKDNGRRYGYIAVSAFSENTSEEFKTHLSDMEKRNIKGLIIDLRDNSGGYTMEGLEIADMLLDEGNITYTVDKHGKKEYLNAEEGRTELKYVVLVNKETASTSEIIAAAVKDNKGGKLVGTTTYGKGLMQKEVRYKDGTALKYSAYEYYSPKGRKINGVGVKPDYVVKLNKNAKEDAQVNKAIELLK